jgi:nitrous oxidase accessory protein
VKEGIYNEYGIVIDKPLFILGENYPIIDAQEQGDIIRIVADSVVISGLELRNVGISHIKDLAGINVYNCDGCQILNNKLTNTFFGVYMQKSRNCVIRDNVIIAQAVAEMSSGNAIHLWYCKKLEIINNKCIRHRDGIYLEFVDSSRIESNLSSKNIRYGLHFMFSNYDNYRNNTFDDNGSGVAVMFSKYINMTGNKFHNNWGNSSYGLLLKDITDSNILNNDFRRNTTGIYAESATRIIIKNNDFQYNGWAIKMLGSSMYNEFTNNNLIGNTIDLTTNTVRNTNIYTENYWSNYTGYDLDRDGYGDIPHKPIQLFSHIVGLVPEAIILVRSPLVDLLNFIEDTTPVFTPEGLEDIRPSMTRILNIVSDDQD